MKDSTTISTKQEKLIAFLVTEPTIEKACEKAGITPVTYWRWTKENEFKREYRKARRTILENAVARLQGLTLDAVDCLARNLNSEIPSIEIRAASMILDLAVKGVEMLDLEERLDIVERVQQNREQTYERIKKQDKQAGSE
jgi:hypothetical protein